MTIFGLSVVIERERSVGLLAFQFDSCNLILNIDILFHECLKYSAGLVFNPCDLLDTFCVDFHNCDAVFTWV